MHGRLFDVACTSGKCGHIEPDIPLEDLPHCFECGALARPGVVWFGEIPHHMQEINDLVGKADVSCGGNVIYGTYGAGSEQDNMRLIKMIIQVYPAASYAHRVKSHGGKTAIFNLERSAGDKNASYLFLGPCEIILPEALLLPDKPTSM